MNRIVYHVQGTDVPRGGHKMAFRHVETLNQNGFNSCVALGPGSVVPQWFNHVVPLIDQSDVASADYLVLPEDDLELLRRALDWPGRKFVFMQNHIYAAGCGVANLSDRELATYADFIACSGTVAGWISRFLKPRSVELIRAFADERMFKPGPKTLSFAAFPGKRTIEMSAILAMVRRAYTGTAPWRGMSIVGRTEIATAAALSEASLFVSLSRLEGLGMSTLEAMASGCLVVGFPGVGGREYATGQNGLWVDDDDCESCADAVLKAMHMIEVGDRRASGMIAQAATTAHAYSHKIFTDELCGFWSKHGLHP